MLMMPCSQALPTAPIWRMARTMSDAELIDRAHGALHDVEVCCSYDVKSFSTADDGRDGLLPGEDHESPLDAPR